ncbi:DUF6884 domain-containing protein [Actinoplanes sp. NPDC051411]|uniref:DUF6884 domain-containing protein n=1 Tax=Actinoplanes sp. NPDC051411 TaxID=3155522 RepID=UPI00341E57F8
MTLTVNTINPLPIRPRSTDPIDSRLIIVACCERKRPTDRPIPALQLYDDGCIPALRTRLGHHARLRGRIRILSARHGLVHADTPLLPYDQALTPAVADQIRAQVNAALARDFSATGTPSEALIIVEPLYLIPLADLLTVGARIHWIPNYFTGWPEASAILDTWSWP